MLIVAIDPLLIGDVREVTWTPAAGACTAVVSAAVVSTVVVFAAVVSVATSTPQRPLLVIAKLS